MGLHTGERVQLVLRPAPPDTGIVISRTDVTPPFVVPALAHWVCDTSLCSCLGVANSKEQRVGTVEHLMSALSGLGVDNLYVDVSAGELPIFDGSTVSFVYLIQEAGIVEQTVPRKYLRIKEAVRVEQTNPQGEVIKWAELVPHDGFRMNFEIDFQHPAIEHTSQSVSIDFSHQSYIKELSRARTFGFVNDVESLRKQGLTIGGGLHNAIVMDQYQILNQGPLRYADEFVRHKMLDAVGDLYLAGHPILGEYSAYKSGHELNNRLVRQLLTTQSAWELIEYSPPANDGGTTRRVT